jgi:hypothetical protein
MADKKVEINEVDLINVRQGLVMLEDAMLADLASIERRADAVKFLPVLALTIEKFKTLTA